MFNLKFEGVERALDDLRYESTDRAEIATMQALNRLAFDARKAWQDEASRVFDRPTPLTRGAALYTKATRQKLTAEIFVRDDAFKGTPPEKYLAPQVVGGARRVKRSERALQAIDILRAGQLTVPGAGAKLDQYGNMRGGELNRLLTQLRASSDQYQNQTKTSVARRRRKQKGKRGGEYFAVVKQRGRLKPGVYERFQFGFGSAVRAILRFVDSATYKKRYSVYEVGQRVFEQKYQQTFDEEFHKAGQRRGA